MELNVFFLFVVYQIKHFICDFPLQGRYMLGKFKDGWDFVPPLAAHAMIHAIVTLAICFAFSGSITFACKMAAIDFGSHSIIDRIKAGRRYLGRWKPDHYLFWWALGFDQLLHHLVHIYIIYLMYNFIN